MLKNKIDLYIDMDGVLSNFVTGVLDLFQSDKTYYDIKEWDIHKSLGVSPEVLWEQINMEGSAFWRDLRPYSWLWKFNKLTENSSYDISIATSPSLDPACSMGKLQWINAYIPNLARKVFIGPEKHKLSHSNAILIDDSPVNCKKFLERGGTAILFPQPWNMKIKDAAHHEQLVDELFFHLDTPKKQLSLFS